jgi:chitin synthase
VSAFTHPREFTDVLYIIIYYLFIPSTYLLLTIYALCNLNDISWGTREVAPTQAAKQREAETELQVRYT